MPQRPEPRRSVERARYLTRREAEVLALIALGFSNSEIASLLYVGEQTVKSHVRHLRAKLGARTRAHAVYVAMSQGLLGTSSEVPSFGHSSQSALTYGREWNGSPDDLWRILTRDSHAA